jgi:hypothetical protein
MEELKKFRFLRKMDDIVTPLLERVEPSKRSITSVEGEDQSS